MGKRTGRIGQAVMTQSVVKGTNATDACENSAEMQRFLIDGKASDWCTPGKCLMISVSRNSH